MSGYLDKTFISCLNSPFSDTHSNKTRETIQYKNLYK